MPCATSRTGPAVSGASTRPDMTGLYREHGIVLRTHKLGEADRIVAFCTEGRGKVRAVAKGVRKTKSKFGSRLEPMSHVALQLYEGRDLDTVTQAETIDHFRSIREDLDRLARATAVLEAVDQVVQQGESNAALYRMLLGALRALEARDSAMLVPAFYFKLLALEGFHPLLDVCAGCGAADDLSAFDISLGGVLCRSCRQGRPLSSAALDLLRRILGGGLSGVLAEESSPVSAEIDELATATLEYHLERRLRTHGILDRG